jgi:predicted MPP superfamily phosphohydrolase
MAAALVWSALALAALGHGFLWTGIVNRLHGWGAPRWLIKLLTYACGAAFVGIPIAIAWHESARTKSDFDPFAGRDWAAAYLWLCLAIGAASLIVKPWIESRRYDGAVLKHWTAERLDVAKALGRKPLHGPVAKLLGSLPGNEVFSVSIDRKRLAIPRLPAELEGLTIAHISDLHMTGGIGREYFGYVVRQVNNLRPDVIAITGDIVENRECVPWLEASLGQLCAPLGVYFILGNHDLLIDGEGTRNTLIDAGLAYLGGRRVRADWNGVTVAIDGNELPWLPAASVEPAASSSSPAQFHVALSHSPDQFASCQRAGVDLVLAGHTHGGQVQLPLLGIIMSPSLYGTRYACGVFRRGDTVMHVTRGISGETPLRWRCPPEIALLELTRETA